MSYADDLKTCQTIACAAAEPPDDVVDAYHKHDCLAVLGRGARAVYQLAQWVRSMEAAGRVEVVDYETGATGMQAAFFGAIGYVVVVHKKEEP